MIVDASAIVASVGKPASGRTIAGEDLAAPDLVIPETLNAFWKLRRVGRIVPDRDEILRLLDHVRIVCSRPHAARADELAEALEHPVYDCLYLALAEAEADVLITADAAFERKARTHGFRKRVRLVSL
ncbi:MAG TPA: type II toxin-antitoxin system VapC family toxin [Candidatus Cybelea sp.]|nr:type II toxin-antitoxin system VapC family toxin [Candidatus Cybelea sp.]